VIQSAVERRLHGKVRMSDEERLLQASQELWGHVTALIAKYHLTFPEWVGIMAGALKNWGDRQPPQPPMA
jgi:hypothetical protein